MSRTHVVLCLFALFANALMAQTGQLDLEVKDPLAPPRLPLVPSNAFPPAWSKALKPTVKAATCSRASSPAAIVWK
ncbi:MAG: hypothetical protein WDO18_13095 [Acidobacteriota bacterium]